jgi:hypothetical protein
MFSPNFFGFRQRQHIPDRHQRRGHYANKDPVVPISKDKLKRWHEKMERLDDLRVTVESLPLSWREKEALRRYTEEMRSITQYVQHEIRDKMQEKRLTWWKM